MLEVRVWAREPRNGGSGGKIIGATRSRPRQPLPRQCDTEQCTRIQPQAPHARKPQLINQFAASAATVVCFWAKAD